MRIANAIHKKAPWRIHEFARDFHLEDVWALPVHGGEHDFGRFVDLMQHLDPMTSGSGAARFLWKLRGRLGKWFDLGAVSGPARGDRLPIPGDRETSVRERLPADLSDTATVSAGNYQPQLAVYAKPRGRFGNAYMRVIAPFRHLIVYPALLREIGKRWDARAQPEAAGDGASVGDGAERIPGSGVTDGV